MFYFFGFVVNADHLNVHLITGTIINVMWDTSETISVITMLIVI